jgi:hypothetical protein
VLLGLLELRNKATKPSQAELTVPAG